MDSADPQLAQEMSSEDVNTISPVPEEVQEDQLEMMDGAEQQLVQEAIVADQEMILAAAGVEKGQEATIDVLAKYMEIEAHDWQNRLRAAIMELATFVPVVGSAIRIVIGLFWPARRVNIWEAINGEQYVRNIVRQEIFLFEMQQLQSDIEALEVVVSRYDRAALNEKGNFLSIWISQADSLSIRMRNSTNRIHLLLHIVVVATLHVAALHERLTFGKELYGENNTANWKEDLVDVFKMYSSNAIPSIFKDWKLWRETQIEIEQWATRQQHGATISRPAVSHATVEDKLTGDRFTYRRENLYSTTVFSTICGDQKTRMMNEATADMASCISPTFGFHKLLPDDIQRQLPAYDSEQFNIVYRGPYSQDLLRRTTTTVGPFVTRVAGAFSMLGRIVRVIIRAGDHVDAIQTFHVGATTQMIGNANGGVRYEVDVGDRHIHEIRMEFARNVLASMQFHFEDGTSTEKFGNRSGWATTIATCTAPPGYMFGSWGMRFESNAFTLIRFHFTPVPP